MLPRLSILLTVLFTFALAACTQGYYPERKTDQAPQQIVDPYIWADPDQVVWDQVDMIETQDQTSQRDIDDIIQGLESDPDQRAADTSYMPATQPAAMPRKRLNIQQFDGSPREVHIAFLVPLSGPHAKLGQSLLNAAQLALFEIGKHNIKLIPKDTKGTPDGAEQAAKDVMANQPDLVLGPLFAPAASAAKPIITRGSVPMIAFTTDWRIAGSNAYVMGFLPFAQVNRIATYAHQQGHRNFGVFAPENAYGEIVANSLESYVYRLDDASVVKRKLFDPSQKDLTPDIQEFAEFQERRDAYEEKLKLLEEQLVLAPEDEVLLKEKEELEKIEVIGDQSYDAIMLPFGGQMLKNIAPLLSYYYVDQKKVKYLGTGLWDDSSLAEEPALRGAWFAAPSPQIRRQFAKRYKDYYGATPPRLASLSYDAMALAIILSNQHALNPFTEDNLTQPNGFIGVDGIFRFHRNGLVERGLAVLEVTKRGLRVVDPAPKQF